MHELSIAMSIVDMAAEEAERRGVRVSAVHLKVGPLSGVIPEALRGAFELACEQSPLAGARLVIDATPLRIFCAACGGEQPAESIQMMRCRQCGTPSGEVVSGRELEVVALEVLE